MPANQCCSVQENLQLEKMLMRLTSQGFTPIEAFVCQVCGTTEIPLPEKKEGNNGGLSDFHKKFGKGATIIPDFHLGNHSIQQVTIVTNKGKEVEMSTIKLGKLFGYW